MMIKMRMNDHDDDLYDDKKCIQCCPSNQFQKFKSVNNDETSHNQFTSL